MLRWLLFEFELGTGIILNMVINKEQLNEEKKIKRDHG